MFAGGPAREHAIAVSCRAKAAIVARDERETGDRMLLNLGHTFGHAFEAAAGFSDRLLHGEAVALGMALAFEFSARRGLIAKAEAERVIAHLAAVGPADPCQRGARPQLPGARRLMDLIAQDKKVKRGRLTFILVRGIGAGLRRAATSMPPRSARSSPRSSPDAMIDSTTGWHCSPILLCLLLSFFFSGSETALTASSRARIAADGEARQPPRRRSSTGCSTARERLIGALLLGNNVGQHRAPRRWRPSVLLALVRRRRRASTRPSVDDASLVVVFTEVLPKTLAINAPERGRAAGRAADALGRAACSARC